MNSFDDIWQSILEILKSEMTEIMFNLYPASLKFERFDSDTVYFSTDRAYVKQVVENKLSESIKGHFEAILGFPVEIVVKEKTEDEHSDYNGRIEQNTQRKLTARYTFESFVTGNENQFAYNIAYGAAERPGTRYNPVMIYGASGLGKTHLLFAAYNKMMENNPDATIIVTSGENFMNELFEHINNKSSAEFHNKYRHADALFIDDIQFIARGGKSVQEEMFYCFESLYNEGKQIFMISDRPPKEMNTLEERLKSRFLSGIIQDILPPDKDTRIVIINKKAQSLGIDIPSNTVNFIAEKIHTNVRQLEGVVNKIGAYRTITGQIPGLEQVKNIINEITNSNQPASLVINKILERVATDTEVSIEDIKSKRRDKKIKDARQVCIYIIRQKTSLTLNEIGEIFSLKHSTVLHAIDQINTEKEENPSLKILLDNIVNDI